MCFLGDSFVAGTGDPEHLGWAGWRLAVRTHTAGRPVTSYNLGVRRQTSAEVRQRWLAECVPRLPSGCDGRLVVSFGVNDTAIEEGRQRVDTANSRNNLTGLLTEARTAGWPVLVVGPPPIADLAHNDRIAHLDKQLERAASELHASHVSLFASLGNSSLWMRQVVEGDGAHPAGEGYSALADLLWPGWSKWLTT